MNALNPTNSRFCYAPDNLQHGVYWWDHETSETSHLADDFADMSKTAYRFVTAKNYHGFRSFNRGYRQNGSS